MAAAPSGSAADDRPASGASANWALVLARGIGGGIVGGIVGYFVFRWLARQGYDGLAIPGALVGLGAGLAARGSSHLLGILSALGGLVLMVYAEWSAFPFVDDRSFSFFVAHVHALPTAKLLLLALGAGFAYWCGRGR